MLKGNRAGPRHVIRRQHKRSPELARAEIFCSQLQTGRPTELGNQVAFSPYFHISFPPCADKSFAHNCKQILIALKIFVFPTHPPFGISLCPLVPLTCQVLPDAPSSGPPGPLLGPPSRSQGKERVRRRTPALSPHSPHLARTRAARQANSSSDTHAPARAADNATRAGDPVRSCIAGPDRARNGTPEFASLNPCLPPTDLAGCVGGNGRCFGYYGCAECSQ